MAFSLSTMFIAVPTGVKILNWMATMYGGRLKFTVAMMFSVGMVAMFTIGGLSGVSHAFAPADTQQTDTYYIVAHFHYVLFGGAVMGLFSGLFFWWQKVFGYPLRETAGKWTFWIMFVGFNLTFGPMHILGLQGMSRRIFTYSERPGVQLLEPGRDDRGPDHRDRLHPVLRERLAVVPCPQASPRAGRGRSVGCPQPRVDGPLARSGAQLRRDPDRHRARRVLASQVRPRRERPARADRRDRGRRPEG